MLIYLPSSTLQYTIYTGYNNHIENTINPIEVCLWDTKNLCQGVIIISFVL